MIGKLERDELAEAVIVIRTSFKTVADELGFTEENAPRFTAFATSEYRLAWQYDHERRPMYVCRRDGRIVGYYSLLQSGDECELNNLCVLPEYRHQKLGEALLADSLERARILGCSVMKLGIVEENVRLRRWYERYGFVHTGTKKFDFFPFTCGYMEKPIA